MKHHIYTEFDKRMSYLKGVWCKYLVLTIQVSITDFTIQVVTYRCHKNNFTVIILNPP